MSVGELDELKVEFVPNIQKKLVLINEVNYVKIKGTLK